jgi:CRP/FNR family transcriptional regulator, cyclic AMP receptor protein
LTLSRASAQHHATHGTRIGDGMTLTHDHRTELLAGTPLLAGVDPKGIAMIAGRMVEVDFAKDHVIARQGEVGTGFFLVASGSVRVVRDGRTLAHIGPGDFFGELSILDGRPRVAQVIADEPTTCLALATWDFETVVREQPAVALAILRGLAGRLRELTEALRH